MVARAKAVVVCPEGKLLCPTPLMPDRKFFYKAGSMIARVRGAAHNFFITLATMPYIM